MALKIEDIIMKNVFDLFKGDAIKFFGIDKQVVAPAQTELNYIKPKDSIMDYTFLLDDDSYAHFEFQTTYKKGDMARFLAYDAVLYYKENKPIKTMVIYSADIENVESNLDAGSIKYSVEPFYMVSIDGDKKYNDLQAKIANHEKLTKQDLMSIVLLPIMKNSVDKISRIEQCIKMSSNIDDKNEQAQIYSMLDLLAEKFIKDKDKLSSVKEMMNVSMIKELYEEGIKRGIKKGIKKGMEKGMEKGMINKAVEVAKSMLSDNTSMDIIAKYTGLAVTEIEKLKIDEIVV